MDNETIDVRSRGEQTDDIVAKLTSRVAELEDEVAHLNLQLAILSSTDAITGLANRTGLADSIEMGPAELSGARGVGLGIYIRDPDDHRIELRTYS